MPVIGVDQRRLAGAVGPDQAEDAAGLDARARRVERDRRRRSARRRSPGRGCVQASRSACAGARRHSAAMPRGCEQMMTSNKMMPLVTSRKSAGSE